MRVNRRRSDIEIVGDMLRMSRNGAVKTKIMYHADMSYSQIQKYLGFLTSQGFIMKVITRNPSAMYYATRSGLELLKSIDNVTEMIGLNDDDKYYTPDLSTPRVLPTETLNTRR